MLRSLVRVALALAVLGSSAEAMAQDRKEPTSEDKARAVRLLSEGDKALKRGDKLMDKGSMEAALAAYESGLSSYQAALAAFPSPKIYFPIGQAEQKLGRFMDALR